MKFPSPLGELYFLMLTTAQLEQVDLLTVSVPSRGAIFLNTERSNTDGSGIRVSVPSRGAIFLNKPEKSQRNPDRGFRPLSGSYIS